MTRSPGLKSLTSLPTASISPAHSRPSRAPMPPTRPCCWPAATPTSARLRLEARTRISTWLAAGSGFGRSRTSAPFSPTTAAFMISFSLKFQQHPGGAAEYVRFVSGAELDLVDQVAPALLEGDHHRGISAEDQT